MITFFDIISNCFKFGINLEEGAASLTRGGGGRYIESYGGRFVI